MVEKELNKLLEEAKVARQYSTENGVASFLDDNFDKLYNFIIKKLNSPFFKSRNTKIIVDHFDEILPYIVSSTIDILLIHNELIEKPNFKEKFIEGLKKYPYKDEIDQLFINMRILNGESDKFDAFMTDDLLRTLSTLNLSQNFYLEILNGLNEESQKNFLNYLVENKCNIAYSYIEYKGDNKQIIYDNLPLFIENAQNLYNLMNFVKDNPVALSQVKDYINSHEEKAINSIFCETNHLLKIKDPDLKEIIKLIVLDVMKNEDVNFSDITYNSGGFSRVLLIGNKVVKLGNRETKKFPNNPYIISPLLRKELKVGDEHCFAEVTERVDTSKVASEEDLYQLFKNLRDLKLVWTDIKDINVGRLTRDNIIHWKDSLSPTEEVLGLDAKRGETVLKEGDLVILDADFIYDENDPNINYTNRKFMYKKFEERYQREKKELKKKEQGQEQNLDLLAFEETKDDEMSEHKGPHR